MLYSRELSDAMIDLSKFIVENYSKEDAIKILDNLKEWTATDCDAYPFILKWLIIGYNGEHKPMHVDYDKDVKRRLLQLYGEASKKGAYATQLLELGLSSMRGMSLLNAVVQYDESKQQEFDITGYISDTKWSDFWVVQIADHTSYLRRLSDFGYDVMSVFTPEHNTATFSQVCTQLKCSGSKIPIDWLRDTHWTYPITSSVLDLYYARPDLNWGGDIIQPWMCSFCCDEIYTNKNQAALDCNSIIEKWKNVSPRLEFALREYMEASSVDSGNIYRDYDEIRRNRYRDGDELASYLHSDDFPDYVEEHNKYYHSVVNSWNGVKVSTTLPKMGIHDFSSSSNEATDKSVGFGSTPMGVFNAAAMMGGD